MGWALAFTGGALLADMQRTLGSEGLWEGGAAVTLIVVVDMVAKESACTLWHETPEGKRQEREQKLFEYLTTFKHAVTIIPVTCSISSNKTVLSHKENETQWPYVKNQ